MPDGNCEFSDRRSSAVDRAIFITKAFVRSARGHHEYEQDAIADVARQCRLGRSVIERFVHRSRHPKHVDADILERIRAAYLRYLRAQLGNLENQIDRVERMGTADPHAQHLLDAARALVRRIEALTGR